MSVIFADNGGPDIQQQSLWSSFRKLSVRVRTATWEHKRLRALEIIETFKDETLDSIAPILQDISSWNFAMCMTVNESAINLIALCAAILISLAPEVRKLPPEVFELLADVLTRVRDLVEHRSRLSLTQRYIRRTQFRKEITIRRNALIDVFAQCSSSSLIRPNLKWQTSLSLSTSSTLQTMSRSSDSEGLKTIGPSSTIVTLSKDDSTGSIEASASPELGIKHHMLDVQLPSEVSTTLQAEVPSALPQDSRTDSAPSDKTPSSEAPSNGSLGSHFLFIYLPSTTPSTLPTAPAFRCEDATTLQREFAKGGVTVSVHSPDDAVSWLESHYDDPLLESIRARNFQGPIAMQLNHTDAALVVFGSIADAMIPQLAKALAAASGFAIVVRSSIDSPLLGFAQADAPPTKSPPTASAEQRQPVSTELAAATEQPVTVSTNHPMARLRGGGADSDDDDDDVYGDDLQTPTPKWEGPCHTTEVVLSLKINAEATYDVRVSSRMQFKMQPRNRTIFPEVLSWAQVVQRLHTEGIPVISSVVRNQILVWISDPGLRTKGRGIPLLTSTYIPNVRTEKYSTITKNITVNLDQDPPVTVRGGANPPMAADGKDTERVGISLRIAPLDKGQKKRPPSVFHKIRNIRNKFSTKASPLDDAPELPMYETVSRGWDAKNMRWRSVVWPTLDRTFHGVPHTSEKAAWKLRWPDAAPVASSATGGVATASSVAPTPAVVVTPPMHLSTSSTPIGLTTISSNTTDASVTPQSSLVDSQGSQDATTPSTSVHSSIVAEPQKS
ncbi:hypothetical protein C8R44DRAFT_888520 [Mycena epipterygia]|nr:hypothetical protein C8R44DRAFT_888520 [Mycena epipterygia]